MPQPLLRKTSDLLCCVCFNFLKHPLTLSCSHSMCLFCLEQISTCSDTCPLGCAESLLTSAIENPVLGRRLSQLSSSVCQNCESVTAEFICVQCDVAFCQACFDDTHKRGVFLEHKRAPLVDATCDDSGECLTHTGTPLDAFCATCDALVCAYCRRSGDHNGHEVGSARNVVAAVRDAVCSAIDRTVDTQHRIAMARVMLARQTAEAHNALLLQRQAVVEATRVAVEHLRVVEAQALAAIDARVQVNASRVQASARCLAVAASLAEKRAAVGKNLAANPDVTSRYLRRGRLYLAGRAPAPRLRLHALPPPNLKAVCSPDIGGLVAILSPPPPWGVRVHTPTLWAADQLDASTRSTPRRHLVGSVYSLGLQWSVLLQIEDGVVGVFIGPASWRQLSGLFASIERPTHTSSRMNGGASTFGLSGVEGVSGNIEDVQEHDGDEKVESDEDANEVCLLGDPHVSRKKGPYLFEQPAGEQLAGGGDVVPEQCTVVETAAALAARSILPRSIAPENGSARYHALSQSLYHPAASIKQGGANEPHAEHDQFGASTASSARAEEGFVAPVAWPLPPTHADMSLPVDTTGTVQSFGGVPVGGLSHVTVRFAVAVRPHRQDNVLASAQLQHVWWKNSRVLNNPTLQRACGWFRFLALDRFLAHEWVDIDVSVRGCRFTPVTPSNTVQSL